MKLWLGCLSCSFLFLLWAYSHTDELTVILAFLGIFGFALGLAFPRWWLGSFLVLGLACPLDEILIGAKWISAPFAGGQPLTACVTMIPVFIATAAGRFSRKKDAAKLQ